MRRPSGKYSLALSKQFRDRSFALISVGVVNKVAQSNIKVSETNYLSNNRNIVKLGRTQNTYASFEENQVRADGKYLFPPKNDEYFQLNNTVGAISEQIQGKIRINFNARYDIKGLTIDFGDSYPTEFTVTNGKDTYNYTLDNPNFTCIDNFDESNYIDIIPTHFIDGDNKRLRINYILMGIGLTFDNEDIVSLKYSESTSHTNEELPSMNISVKVIDDAQLFNVDDTSSFINYLADGQELSWSIGQELEDGKIEYLDMPMLYLSGWNSDTRYMTFTATDRFALLNSPYTAGNTIHERTLYDDAIAVLTAAGLEPDEYFVDTCLKDITVNNPLPAAKESECLQIISNAGRCALRQGVNGKVLMQGNFETIVEPEDLVLTATNEAEWSHGANARFGSDIVYADLTRNFACADGSMLFIPSDSSEYLDGTTYVTGEIADIEGNFTVTPSITLELPAAYTYHTMAVIFNGNPPPSMNIKSYYDNELIDNVDVTVTDKTTYIFHSFIQFNKLVFSFTKGVPYNRILVNKIALGEITDYVLDRFSMNGEPVGAMDKKTKDVRVKVCSFNPPSEEGQDPELVEDNVFGTYSVSTTGDSITFENQLVGSMEHAELIAKWLGNYYKNNVTYKVKYRGDPRLDASDIIYLESKLLNNLQVEIESLDLEFNGALSGTLNLRRAVNMLEED